MNPSPSRRVTASALAACAALIVGMVLLAGAPALAREGARLPAQGLDTRTAIAFADFPGGGEEKELYIVQADGTTRVQLTDSAGLSESQPSWSPDRRRLAYTAQISDDPNLPAEQWGIHTIEIDSRATNTITAGPLDFEPDWSPDGALIAFTSWDNAGSPSQLSSISVVAPDGTGLRPLVLFGGKSHLLANPAWSPDGRTIAFSVLSAANGGELYTMHSDGRGAQRLLAHPGWDDIDPAWSPDGTRLAFASGFYRGSTSATQHSIWLLDLEQRTYGTIAAHAAFDLRQPTWSPDGRRIAFYAQVKSPPAGKWELYVVPWRGGPLGQPVTTGVEPDWAAAGSEAAPTATPQGASPTVPPGTPSPTTRSTNTPPVVPSLPPLPTLPVFPTFPPAEPTLTPGAAPTFPAPPDTPETTPTDALGATPSPTTRDGGPEVAFLPYAASSDVLGSPPALPASIP